jgi:hypothetical protein
MDTVPAAWHLFKNIKRTSEGAMFFRFPEDARWNEDRQAVEFSVGIGEYEGIVTIARHVFRRFVDGTVAPEKCLEAYHLHRTNFERVAERKLRNRQLTDNGNVEITGRDVRAFNSPEPAQAINDR